MNNIIEFPTQEIDVDIREITRMVFVTDAEIINFGVKKQLKLRQAYYNRVDVRIDINAALRAIYPHTTEGRKR